MSQFSTEETAELAWLLQCKCWAATEIGPLQTRSLTCGALPPRNAEELCLLLCKTLFSVKNKGFYLSGANMNGCLSLGSGRCIITRQDLESSLNHR